MNVRSVFFRLFILFLTASPFVNAQRAGDSNFRLHRGDRVVLLGNTFVERMVEFGYFEALLNARLPKHRLTIRNLGWSADTLTIQLRPLSFGDYHEHLRRQQADVVLLCFGMNESYSGSKGLAAFEKNLQTLIDALRSQRYNNRNPPRLALVSPIPHERLGPLLPDPTLRNEQLKKYTLAMGKIAEHNQIPFVDLHTPMKQLMDRRQGDPLTMNGIHLTQYGYWVSAQLLVDGLGFSVTPRRVEIDAAAASYRANGVTVSVLTGGTERVAFKLADGRLPVPPPPPGSRAHPELLARQLRLQFNNLAPGRYSLEIDGQRIATDNHERWAAGITITSSPAHSDSEELRRAVQEKNQQFFYRWRAVNGEYIYGRRAKPFGVISFPSELEKLDDMVRDADQIIWDLAAPANLQEIELVPE